MIRQVCERFLALKSSCVHPETKQPYIASTIGGKDISPERLQVCQHHPELASSRTDCESL